MAEHGRYDVLIVGLGPVGAVLAALCAKLGLSVRVVEKDTAVYRLPRAVQIDYEVLRLLNFVGVADDVLTNSCASSGYEFVNRDRKILMSRYPPPGLAPTGYPWANMFHQPSLESALRARLDECPDVEVSLGATVTGIEQDGVGVTAVVESDEGTQRVDAAYAVGCDGGRSLVRRTLGIDMVDLGFEEPWVVVDVRLPPGVRQLTEVSVQLCDPAGPTTSVLSGPGRHRWEFMLRPGDDHDAATDPATLKARLADWVDSDTVELERSAVYEFHGLIARRWRSGRILLIGDAAHQMPPFFGQGLCSGVRDACNLAWKLAAVLRGEVDAAFLDSVQAERGPPRGGHHAQRHRTWQDRVRRGRGGSGGTGPQHAGRRGALPLDADHHDRGTGRQGRGEADARAPGRGHASARGRCCGLRSAARGRGRRRERGGRARVPGTVPRFARGLPREPAGRSALRTGRLRSTAQVPRRGGGAPGEARPHRVRRRQRRCVG